MSICAKNSPPFYQCCCECEYRVKVHHHCATAEGANLRKRLEKRTGKPSCVCSIQKGYACIAGLQMGSDRIHDKWPKHSSGCELHSKKEGDE